MRITGYAFEADLHCVDCTRKRFIAGPVDIPDPCGIPYNAKDREGNPIHPIFYTDEQLCTPYCGDCEAELT